MGFLLGFSEPIANGFDTPVRFDGHALETTVSGRENTIYRFEIVRMYVGNLSKQNVASVTITVLDMHIGVKFSGRYLPVDGVGLAE